MHLVLILPNVLFHTPLPQDGRSQFPSSTGFLERLWPFAYQDTTRYGKIRKAPVKVEPKVKDCRPRDACVSCFS